MTRKATLPNRQDTNRRATPHDLASSKPRGILADFDLCNPCRDCKPGGSIVECTHCRAATNQYRFRFPDVEQLVESPDSDLIPSHEDYAVVWAADCIWQSDEFSIACDYIADQFGWTWTIEGRELGDAVLKFERIAGGSCEDVYFEYRSFFPLRCLCPALLFLDPETVRGVDPDRLPCTLCIRPHYDECTYPPWGAFGEPLAECGCPDNWQFTNDGFTYRTTSGPISFNDTVTTRYCMWWGPEQNGYFPRVELIFESGAFQLYTIARLCANPWAGMPLGGDCNPAAAWWKVRQPVTTCEDSCHDGQELELLSGTGDATITLNHRED